ncbi:hypothetical protein MTO96_001489 [Rhipicephalus appendiculatus]
MAHSSGVQRVALAASSRHAHPLLQACAPVPPQAPCVLWPTGPRGEAKRRAAGTRCGSSTATSTARGHERVTHIHDGLLDVEKT